MEPINLEMITQESDFAIKHIGYRDGEIRIILKEISTAKPLLVIRLKKVRAYFDRGAICNKSVIIICNNGVGSFGWWMPRDEVKEYHELHINNKVDNTDNLFRAIVGNVEIRSFNELEDKNFPG